MKYYTADMHLDHHNVIKLSKRPFDGVNDMQEALIKNWNDVVTNADDVYHLGDFCFNADAFLEMIGKLNGTKHFLIGNHDSKAIAKLIKMKESRNKELKRVFFHGYIKEVKDGNHKVILCHYPIFEWHGWHSGRLHLHGHTHGNIGESFKENAFDVGVDVYDYRPHNLSEIITRGEKYED